MAKIRITIGFAKNVETLPGIFKDEIEERVYRADVLQQTKTWRETQQVNDDLIMGNRLSILGDDFANLQKSSIKYVNWDGVKWKVTTITDQRPRLILNLGGVYNE